MDSDEERTKSVDQCESSNKEPDSDEQPIVGDTRETTLVKIGLIE